MMMIRLNDAMRGLSGWGYFNLLTPNPAITLIHVNGIRYTRFTMGSLSRLSGFQIPVSYPKNVIEQMVTHEIVTSGIRFFMLFLSG
jgi:hypothetical protein